ncbi:hypothetical protein PI125_g3258 [Phytophthora idaei]|nr:hypothetical protein PI125_g3258 [Phytophthora idaei]
MSGPRSQPERPRALVSCSASRVATLVQTAGGFSEAQKTSRHQVGSGSWFGVVFEPSDAQRSQMPPPLLRWPWLPESLS